MHLLNLFDYEQAAKEKLSTPNYAFYAGGVADNLTLRDNRAAFERLRLRPRVLVGVESVSLATTVQGQAVSMPILIAPAGHNKLAHPDGELAVARAAKEAGTIQILSTMSDTVVEEVAAVGGSTWFQLYVARERQVSERLIERAEAAGCEALVLTVDVPIPGLRENLLRAGFQAPPLSPHLDSTEVTTVENTSTFQGFVRNYLDPSLTWDDVRWLKSVTKLPIWLKGILRGDDARRAVDCGVTGIIVSNHGGRQLDTAIAGIDALPDVVQAVEGQGEVLVDGGIRRGTDIVKALALGAKAVLVGRPPLWGLTVEGQAGVTNILNILRHELETAMALCGCPSVKDVAPDLIFRL